MSLKIDPKRLASGDLTDDEYKMLQERNQLPKGLPFRPELAKEPVLDLDDVPSAPSTATPLEEQTVPTIGDSGGIMKEGSDLDDDLVGIPYEDKPWTNDRRREWLAYQGLSIDGSLSDLCERLERADNDLLTEEDYPESEED